MLYGVYLTTTNSGDPTTLGVFQILEIGTEASEALKRNVDPG